ncbi:MAG: HlyC/CorC family transporter [Clostridia bacterium]|nr:HlyC/CorC family transporter [Clostridia bacterium]
MSIPSTVLIIVLLVFFSAFFSASETAFSSLNKTRLKTMAEKGSHGAERALALSEKYDRLLSTILIDNNIVNIASASLATILFVQLLQFEEGLGTTLSTVVMTVVVLIFGEISPKTIAKESPERFAIIATPFIRFFMILLFPFVAFFSLWKKLLSLVFKSNESRTLTQDELLVLVEEVTEEGGIDEEEGKLLHNALEFTDLDVESILTPRVELEAVSVEATKEEVASVFTDTRYSRILVYKESIDTIVGVIHQKDFYTGTGVSPLPLEEIMTEPVFVPKSMKISVLLRMLQKSQSHIAVIGDNYGGTLGIVTMEDILEELVGEIWDEHDEVVETITKIDENTYRVDGGVNWNEFCETFGIESDEDNTVTGWVMEKLGTLPSEGDSFVDGNLSVTLLLTDERRVAKAQITILPEEKDEEAEEDKHFRLFKKSEED